jgi:hypothetical protein
MGRHFLTVVPLLTFISGGSVEKQLPEAEDLTIPLLPMLVHYMRSLIGT